MSYAVVGRGALGTRLARALRAAGAETRLLAGRGSTGARVARADVVVLAVPDAAIAQVASRLAPALSKRHVVLHVAGSRDARELDAVAAVGGAVGVCHPFVSFARGARGAGFVGATFFVGGDARAVRAGRGLARVLGARAYHADLHGARYHAAAALAANGTVGLAYVAGEVLGSLGVTHDAADDAIAGILESVADNIRRVGLPEALTGPVARGDAETVTRHLRALEGAPADARAVYDAVAKAVLACSVARGLDASSARRVARALRATADPTPRRR